jgi:hypothetical protein
MKFRRPQKLIKEQIQEPIQTIAVIALIALAIAAMALFIAVGKGNDATADN